MSFLDRRVRGFRLVDLVALGMLMVIILGVYLAKTLAGRERAEIATVERQIDEERARIRLLKAEVSHLEQPARVERLSETYLGLGPVAIKRETTPDGLVDVARGAQLPSAASSPVAKEAQARAAMALTPAAVAPAPAPAPVAEAPR